MIVVVVGVEVVVDRDEVILCVGILETMSYCSSVEWMLASYRMDGKASYSS